MTGTYLDEGRSVVFVGVRDDLADALAAADRRTPFPDNLVLRRGTGIREVLADIEAGRTPTSDRDPLPPSS